MDVFTVAGIRGPDIGVIDRAGALASLKRDERAHKGADVCLVVEVISRYSGSERTDRYEKLGEYAATGIPHYWVVDLEPEVNITLYQQTSHFWTYRRVDRVFAGTTLKVDAPVPIEFDPGDLLVLG
ncbi:Uma2 family endonuclease [Acrocarpospora catenulata]|uniref:Uma2 family endonuclease n=1 Tax=Acrocarpospora catenulata TaxID=2836182 RepID=UPI001BDAC607|nr:Uma2 family endonuclease [Acrocarpospora catenulata]